MTLLSMSFNLVNLFRVNNVIRVGFVEHKVRIKITLSTNLRPTVEDNLAKV